MIIENFSIKNFRSIINAEKLPLSSLSILIGPNNEGKTNFLQGLILVLNYLGNEGMYGRRNYLIRKRNYRYREEIYDWSRDFPLNEQQEDLNGRTNFAIEFTLSRKEIADLKRSIKHKLEGNLLINLTFSRSGEVKVTIKDSAKKKLKIDEGKVLQFIKKRISVQYIGAIRTSAQTLDIIDDMISEEMKKLNKDKEYRDLIEKIQEKQKPLVDKLAKNLTKSINEFLPDVKKIEIDKNITRVRHNYSSTDLMVDDGVKTSLEQKGDGIKSLLAISVIQHVIKEDNLEKNILLAIEEPEAHLHPKAIHAFRNVLEEVSKENQIIITTHSPLLVNRDKIKSNLLVSKSQAKTAENINEVRDLLGVNISDNLVQSNLVIISEGPEDIEILKKWFIENSVKLQKLISDGSIVFDSLCGGSNLSYKLTHWKGLLCDTFIFLDNDKSAKESIEKAKNKNLIEDRFLYIASINGMDESEIEDLIEIDLYKQEFFDQFGVTLEGKHFKNNKKKWSDRLRNTFENQGKPWDNNIKIKCKQIVEEKVLNSNNSIKKSSKSIINSIVKNIESYFDEKYK